MTEFTHIVSLGYRCRLAERLRRHFGFERAFPFDWWITPLRGGADFLREWDADLLYDPDLLVEERERRGDIAFIRNERYQIKLQHEFPHARPGAVAPGWRDHLAAAKARTLHLMARFDALDDPACRPLFVRELSVADIARSSAVARLREAVARRAGAAKAEFLLVSPAPVEAPGWDVLVIDDPAARPWQGDPEIWNAALVSLNHRLVSGPAGADDAKDAGPTQR